MCTISSIQLLQDDLKLRAASCGARIELKPLLKRAAGLVLSSLRDPKHAFCLAVEDRQRASGSHTVFLFDSRPNGQGLCQENQTGRINYWREQLLLACTAMNDDTRPELASHLGIGERQ